MEMADVWRVRLEPAEPAHRGRVFDAETGADVSARFPARYAHRLARTLVSGQPIRLALFCLNDQGRPYLDGPGHLAREPRWVRVVGPA